MNPRSLWTPPSSDRPGGQRCPIRSTRLGTVPLIPERGISGSGKSTVCLALRAQGHAAYDADESGVRTWRRLSTGESVDPARWPVPPGWHKEHHMPINPTAFRHSRAQSLRSLS